MPLSWLCRGAYRKVAPLAFLASLAAAAQGAPRCPADRVDEQVTVARVFDGDTVRLRDGRHVRLIGIDAPEVAHPETPAQPLAEEARAALDAQLGANRQVGLRYDAERTDQYGRTLAHVILPDGTDAAAELLAAGLASALVVPPNLWNQGCLAEQERSAHAAQRGVWTLPAYRGVESTALRAGSNGVYRVEGTVKRIGHSRKSEWITLDGGLEVRIPAQGWRYFEGVDLRALRGRRIRVHGRIYSHGKRMQMTIQHPSALSVLP